MRYLPFLVAGALYSLSAFAQTNPVGALFQANAEYQNANARLTEVRSDCERTLVSPLNCNTVFGRVATDISRANDQLDTVARTFVPKVPCASISTVFIYFQGNITLVNDKLRDIACSTAVATQAAAKLNADALRRALSDQVVKVDLIGSLSARNDACNNPQSAAALQRFANVVKAVDADDKKTAQAFTLLGGTVGCLV
ncbi:MAG: hypothetical protein Q9178_007265 [Gyalolechia marmorata]